MLDYVCLVSIRKDIPKEWIAKLYRDFKDAYDGGQTYRDCNLTLQECVDWLRDIDSELGEIVQESMMNAERLYVFTGFQDNALKEIAVIDGTCDRHEQRLLVVGITEN